VLDPALLGRDARFATMRAERFVEALDERVLSAFVQEGPS
jgi:hypothetical protein